LIALHVFSQVHAQDQAIVDSLQIELSETKEDNLRVAILIQLGDKEGMSNYYTNMSSLKNSVGQNKEALEFA